MKAKKPSARLTRPTQRYTAREFRPYVAALGQLILAWNDMQESFAELFWHSTLSRGPRPGDSIDYTPLRIWRSLHSDRQQRGLLRSIVDHLPHNWGRPEAVSFLKNALSQADRLEERRNDAIHASLFYKAESLYGQVHPGGEQIVPATYLLNNRAQNLQKRKNILAEFRYCRDCAITLSDHVQEVSSALVNPHFAWPEILKMPHPPS
jgi:hypothetical protein